jgi:hypothetical protein
VGALAAALPMRVMGEEDRRAMVGIYRDAVLAEAAATDADLDQAVANLIRHADWWPTLRQLLEALREVIDRRLRRDVAIVRPSPAPGNGLQAAVASGAWDRAAARARVVARWRRERHARLLAAYWASVGGEARDRRKRLDGILAVADVIATYWPEPGATDIDDELREMGAAGLLRRRDEGAGDG